ncbi:ATP-grasp fold amidoligase family protein [Brachybacterium kimchii]|uniref:ATP-grasp domain-containing protein n=1 Tax=Brachybacterium kimchii TaxID=2942909 RepID=A0ABY4N0P8_9MICO|nr:ATP-grasp fold amidoligase family protein [Brachybacterium kimchii]UQN28086.1 hypothetical protein M4486_10515 [Brachybacterium kimchii]
MTKFVEQKTKQIPVKYDDNIQSAINSHLDGLRQIWRLVRTVKMDPKLTESERNESLARLFAPLSYKDIQQNFVMDGIKHDVGVSFRSSMANMMRLKRRLRQRGYVIAPGGNNKVHDFQFGRQLGIPVPRTFADGVRAEMLQLRAGTIIKPTQGANSQGVYLVQDDLSLLSIKTRMTYNDFEEAARAAGVDAVKSRWICEEAVLGADGNLAPDMKIYAFYGEPGLFIEIERGTGKNGRNRHATFGPGGDRVDVNLKYEMMSGNGIPEGAADIARTLSINTPVPFLRIDLLAGVNGCFLGEITPHPGDTYAGDLRDQADREFGEMFLEAEARLLIDLLEGKSFSSYFSVYGASPSTTHPRS